MPARRANKASLEYYRVLQVQEDAEPEVIQAAYRTLSKKYHPDTNKDAGAEEQMKRLNEAYAVLGDEQRRTEYDKQRQPLTPASNAATRTRPAAKTAEVARSSAWNRVEPEAASSPDESAMSPRAKNYKLKSFTALGQEIEKVLLTYGPQDVFWLARYVSQSGRTGAVSRSEIQIVLRADNGRVFKIAWTDNGKPIYDLAAI